MTKDALEHQVAQLQEDLRQAQARIIALEGQALVLSQYIDGLISQLTEAGMLGTPDD
jgi:hypothetical protein